MCMTKTIFILQSMYSLQCFSFAINMATVDVKARMKLRGIAYYIYKLCMHDYSVPCLDTKIKPMENA